MVGTEQGSGSLLQINLDLLDFFFFLNDHFLLFILASVAANHKTATELQRVGQNCPSMKVRS